MVAAGFEDVVEAYHVRLDIGIGVLNAVAHAGLCREVYHNGRPILREQSVYGSPVGDIPLDERPRTIRVCRADFSQAVFLQCYIVVVVHVVYADDGGTRHILQQPHHQIGADESGCTRDKNGLMV